MSEHRNIAVRANMRDATEHTLKQLEQYFRKGEYTPVDSMNKVMYTEGQQSVLNFIRRRLLGRNE